MFFSGEERGTGKRRKHGGNPQSMGAEGMQGGVRSWREAVWCGKNGNEGEMRK